MPIASWSPWAQAISQERCRVRCRQAGGTSQTAVVRAAGGQTQKAALVTAGAALATMLFLAPLLGLLPNATLAMLVIVYSVGLIQPGEFVAIRKVRTMEFRWAMVAALGVLLFGTLQGIVVAIIASLISLSTQATRPMVHVIGRKRGADVLRPVSPEHAGDETFEGLLILRPEGRLFFANVQNVADQVKALTLEHQPCVLALDLSRVPDIEYSALQMIMESEKRATERGAVLWLAGLNPTVLEVVRRAGFDKQLGDRLIFNARMVIERYQALRAAGVETTF
jgi:MFS superfamily sulfate permease-like transporter